MLHHAIGDHEADLCACIALHWLKMCDNPGNTVQANALQTVCDSVARVCQHRIVC